MHHPTLTAAEASIKLGKEPTAKIDAGTEFSWGVQKRTFWLAPVGEGESPMSFGAGLEQVEAFLSAKAAFLTTVVETGGDVTLSLNHVVEADQGIIFDLQLSAWFFHILAKHGIDLKFR